jgi:hypothetical protein
MQRGAGGADNPLRQGQLSQGVELFFKSLEVGLVLRGVENLKGDDRRDGYPVVLERRRPVRCDLWMLRVAPD